jgi:hypothetical protein
MRRGTAQPRLPTAARSAFAMILASWLQSKAGHRHRRRCDLMLTCARIVGPIAFYIEWLPHRPVMGRDKVANPELLGIPLAFDNSEQSPA